MLPCNTTAVEIGGDRRRAEGILSALVRRWIIVAAVLLLGLAALLIALMTLGGKGEGEGTAPGGEKPQHAGPPRLERPGPPIEAPPAADLGQVELVPAEVAIDPDLASGAFEGVVVSWGSGKPVPDAELTFGHEGAAVSVRSDATGRFRLEPPAVGRYRLAVVNAEGFLPYAPELGSSPIELVARPRKRVSGIRVYLTPAIDYTGVVLDAAGKPVAGAEVIRVDGNAASALFPLTERFTSKADGTFVFHAFDDTVFEASHPEAGYGRGILGGAEQISHRLEIRLSPEGERPKGSIAGVVVDESGQPIAGAKVVALLDQLDGSRSESPVREARAGDDGRFALSGLDARPHSITATAEGHARNTVVARPGEKNVRIKLAAGLVITGRVFDAGGAPVPSFTVVASKILGPLERGGGELASVFDGDGVFEIGGLDAGEYAVVASGAGHAPSAEVKAVAAAAGDAEPITITLPRGGALTGQVLDAASGAPLENARVSTESRMGIGAMATPAIASAVTGADGRFRLPGLAPGKTSVNVAAYAHHRKLLTGIEIVDGADVGPLRIELEPTRDGEKPRTEFAGIGCAIAAAGDGFRINKVFPGSGCEEAGLERDDVIVAVEGVAVVDLGFDPALQRLRGPEGTRVRVSLRRAEEPIRDVIITRRKITL